MRRTQHTAIVILSLVTLACGLPAAFGEETELQIPWTGGDLQEAFSVGTEIVYSRTGTDEAGRQFGGTHSFKVEESSPQIVEIYSIWEDGGERSHGTNAMVWEDAAFLFSYSNSQLKVLGSELVETPLGSFDTVVVEVSHDFHGTRQTYWMIPDRPGIYARVVDHGKKDSPKKLVMTLKAVTTAGS